MPVSRDVAVAVPNLEEVAVAGAPARAGNDAVSDRAHGRARRGRIVGSFVHPPAAEDWVLASAEHARYAAELERRAEKCGAHRLAGLVEVLTAHGLAGEPHRVDEAPRQLERRGDHLPHPYGARRRDGTLGDDLEFVARLEIAAHVDAILVDVGERPGQLLASPSG